MLSRNTFRWVSFNPIHQESLEKRRVSYVLLVERMRAQMHPMSAANELFNDNFREFTNLFEICELSSPLSTERGLYSAV